MDCSSASDNFSTYHLHIINILIESVPLDVCECIKPVAELEHPKECRVNVCTGQPVTDPEA